MECTTLQRFLQRQCQRNDIFHTIFFVALGGGAIRKVVCIETCSFIRHEYTVISDPFARYMTALDSRQRYVFEEWMTKGRSMSIGIFSVISTTVLDRNAADTVH